MGQQLERRINLQLFAQDKTEPATPRRRQEARRKGQVARSAEIGTALVLVLGVLLLQALGGYYAQSMMYFTWEVLDSGMESHELTQGGVHRLFIDMTLQGAKLALPMMALAALVGLASQAAQVGFLFIAEPLRPKAERINPLSGLKRILSKRAAVELLKALLKVTLIGTVGYLLVRRHLPIFPNLMLLPPQEAVALVGRLVVQIGLVVGALLIVLAAADYAYARYEFNQSIRMTKREVRDEMRQSEGDPLLRSRLRQRQREIAARRMMQDVPSVDVVVTNPIHLAVALRFDADKMSAPVVVAKGAGKVAERIKAVAEENDVAVVENVWLAQSLFHAVPVGGEIPEELYQAVAEVLAFVYRLKGRV